METTLVQERGRIDAGGVGWTVVWRAIARSVMAMQVCGLRGPGEVCFGYHHHADGAALASTPDGGIKFGRCTAGSGDARLGGATLVWARQVKATVFVVAARFGASRRRHMPNPGDVVLDPFAGSGTTLAVATSMGRLATGIELNPDYAAIARRRVEAA